MKLQNISFIFLIAVVLTACTSEPGFAPIPADMTLAAQAGDQLLGGAQTEVAGNLTATAQATSTPPPPPYTVVGIVDIQPMTFSTLFVEGPNVAIYASNGCHVVEYRVTEKVAQLEAERREYTLHIGINADQWGGEDCAIMFRNQYPNAVIVVFHERDLTKIEELKQIGAKIATRVEALEELPYLLEVP